MGTSIKHLCRKSSKGIVCPPCGHVVKDELVLEGIFGSDRKASIVCPSCGTVLTVFRNYETTYSSFLADRAER